VNRPKQDYRVGVGATTMLTIFVVLCVATLALLALSGARGDQALTQRASEMTSGYYQASDLAQKILSQLDPAVRKASAEAQDQQEFDDRLSNLSIDGISIAYNEGVLSFDVDAGGGRKLSVAVDVSPAGQKWQITRYQLTGGDLWTGENGSLNLFN
jgi:hypothetical protein